MPDKKDIISDKISHKARVSFFIDIEADNEELYNELIDDIKFHFKEVKSSNINVFGGKSSSWKVSKQKKDDVIIKIIKQKK